MTALLIRIHEQTVIGIESVSVTWRRGATRKSTGLRDFVARLVWCRWFDYDCLADKEL